MTLANKKCVVCGKEFTPKCGSQLICGSEECLKARRKQYAHTHAELCRELIKKHRQNPKVKQHMAEYDKKYQQEHKEQIRLYKQIYYQKKRFLEHLNKGELIKNSYYFTLSADEKKQILDKLNNVWYSKRVIEHRR